ncbi:MAG: N-6 DNA methylase [Myxococcota bacterium]
MPTDGPDKRTILAAFVDAGRDVGDGPSRERQARRLAIQRLLDAHPDDPLLPGQLYETLLGVALVTEGGALRARKSRHLTRQGGSYYTPLPVVDLLLDRVLSPLLAARPPDALTQLRILDPACGGGFFLVRAYQRLVQAAPEHAAPLKGALFGVDLDPDAVWVTRLALDRVCPNHDAHLICADALAWLGDERLRFDAIIGNPPYIKEKDDTQVFCALRAGPFADTYAAKMDLWYSFSCAAFDRLADGGRHGFVAQNNWIAAGSARILRQRLREQVRLEALIDFHEARIFPGASIQTMIYVVSQGAPTKPYPFTVQRLRPQHDLSDDGAMTAHHAVLSPSDGGGIIEIVSEEDQALLAALRAAGGLTIHSEEVGQGIIGGPDEAFLYDLDQDFTEDERALLRPHHTATAGPFHLGEPTRWIAYLTHHNLDALDPERHPAFRTKMQPFRARLEQRREVQRNARRWFHLHWPRAERLFQAGPKLICPTRVRRPAFVYTERPAYVSRAINVVVSSRLDLKYRCGILNSAPVHFWLRSRKRLGAMLQIDTAFLRTIPLPAPTTAQRAQMHSLVDALTRSPEDPAAWASLESLSAQIFSLSPAQQQRMMRALDAE